MSIDRERLARALHASDVGGCWSVDIPGQRQAEPHAFDYEDAAKLADAYEAAAPGVARDSLDVERLAPLLATEFGKAGFFRSGASTEFLETQARLMLEDVAHEYAAARPMAPRSIVRGVLVDPVERDYSFLDEGDDEAGPETPGAPES